MLTELPLSMMRLESLIWPIDISMQLLQDIEFAMTRCRKPKKRCFFLAKRLTEHWMCTIYSACGMRVSVVSATCVRTTLDLLSKTSISSKNISKLSTRISSISTPMDWESFASMHTSRWLKWRIAFTRTNMQWELPLAWSKLLERHSSWTLKKSLRD